jgi:pimeloyl-ACP methyl ester carboxylesterase
VPFFNSGNTKLYYEVAGDGEAIIFLHGFSLDHRMWLKQIEHFSRQFRVIALDARGHGCSDAPESDYSREDRVNDILNLSRHENLDEFHLVALSMGGGDALSFAIDFPEKLKSLTVVGTVAAGWRPSKKFKDYSTMARQKGIEEARKDYIEDVLINYQKRNPSLKKKLESMMKDFSGKPWTDPMKGKYSIRFDLELLHDLKVPTLIVVGQKDILFRPMAEKLNDLISGSKLAIMAGVGHMANMEAPDEFNSILDKFLEEN